MKKPVKKKELGFPTISMSVTVQSSALSIWLMRQARRFGKSALADDYLCQAIECEEAQRGD